MPSWFRKIGRSTEANSAHVRDVKGPTWLDRVVRRLAPDDDETDGRIRPMTPEEMHREANWLNRPRDRQWRRLR